MRDHATQLSAVRSELARVSAAARRAETALARSVDASAGLRYERGAMERGAVMWLMGAVEHPSIGDAFAGLRLESAAQSAVLRNGLTLSSAAAAAAIEVRVLLCTVTFYANRAHSLTRSP